MKRVLQKLLVGAVLVFGASWVGAACTQEDMTGIWYLSGISGDASLGSLDETDYCKIKVNSLGRIVGSVSSCKARVADGVVNLAVGSGRLIVRSNCKVVGAVNYCDSFGSCNFSLRIDQAQLDRSKSVLNVSAYAAWDTNVIADFVGIKR